MNDTLHQQLLGDLLVESFEGLDRFDRDLLSLENGSGGKDTLNSIFRTIHTIKGTSGCLGLGKIEKLAHTGENLLDLVRNGKFGTNADMISTLLRLSDALREMLRSLEATGTQGERDNTELVAELVRLADGKPSGHLTTPPPAPAATPSAKVEEPAAGIPDEAAGFGLFEEPAAPEIVATPKVPEPDPSGFGLFTDPEPQAEAPKRSAPSAEPSSHSQKSSEATSAPATPTAIAATTPAGPSIADSAIRVDVGQLDRLMNLVGELVLARNQIVQNSVTAADTTLLAAAQRLNMITTELQEGVMKTRMQPIGNVWAKFPRIVRDVSHELGKQVRLEMEGKETELDRTIIEAIKDPLTHIIRNSIDHGIEAPSKRHELGKPDEGLLCLRAYHESSQVNIEIADDGAGLNVERIKAKGVEKGLITREQASKMSDREVFGLIFLPGFSTAEKITNVSGRGVGMDVVKTNIEKIGGSVDVQSTLGHGAVFKLKIPLTLAIVPALIVKSNGDRFAIPRLNLVELVRLDGEAARKAQETVYGAPVFRLRGQLLPLLFLNDQLKLNRDAGSGVLNIVVVQADNRQFGLVLDEVCDTEEIVVKPLGKHFKGLPMYAGATIMGDGAVALILDILGLAQHAGILGDQTGGSAAKETGTVASLVQKTQLLIFSVPGRDRLAIPLDQAARLEEFETKGIEHSGDSEAVQYRGAILPLVRIDQMLPGCRPPAERDSLEVIVFQHEDSRVGIVVGEIVDIIEEEVVIKARTKTAGIKGSAVIQGKITDLVDVPALLANSLHLSVA